MRTGEGTAFQFIIMTLLVLPVIFRHKISTLRVFGLSPIAFLILFYVYGTITLTYEIIKGQAKTKKELWEKWKYLITLIVLGHYFYLPLMP